MAKIKHINCPKCGGTLGLAGMDRVVKCRYCATWSLVEAADITPEYWVKPLIKGVDARRLVQNVLRDDEMPDGLIKETRFHSSRMYFVPYHEMTGKRLGTMTITDFKEQRPVMGRTQTALTAPISSFGRMHEFDGHVGMRDIRAPKQKVVDTRVVMSDLTRNEPAVKLDAWALDESDVEAVRTDMSGMLKPMNRRAMENLGKIHDPTITPDQMLGKLEHRAGAANLDDRTEFAEIRVKRIYYPVWRIRYRYQGRLYGATVDGVTGKVMALRAPQDDRTRVLWMLGTTAMVAFILGRMIYGLLTTHIIEPEHAGVLLAIVARGFVFIIPVIIFGLLLATLVLGFGWEQFRYPGDIVIRGKKREVEKINRPDQTVFDKLATILGGVLGAWFKTDDKERSIWS